MQEYKTVLLAILETQGPRLHGLLFRLTLSQDVAEELMQELFIHLHQSSGFAQAADPVAYAYRSAMHLAFSWRRAQRRTSSFPLIDDPPTYEPSPLTRLARSEEIGAVLDAVRQLDDPWREVLILRYLQQESYEFIAALVGTTPHRVRAICHKALTRLRDRLNRSVRATEAQEDSHVTD